MGRETKLEWTEVVEGFDSQCPQILAMAGLAIQQYHLNLKTFSKWGDVGEEVYGTLKFWTGQLDRRSFDVQKKNLYREKSTQKSVSTMRTVRQMRAILYEQRLGHTIMCRRKEMPEQEKVTENRKIDQPEFPAFAWSTFGTQKV
jgi:hypothetical protein